MFGHSLPWDCQNPIGYLGEIVFLTVCGGSYLHPNGAIQVFFISMCLHHYAFFEMFEYSVSELNSCREKREYMDQLCKIIRFYVMTKK